MNPPSPIKSAIQAIIIHAVALLTGGLLAHGWLDAKSADGLVAWTTANISIIAQTVIGGLAMAYSMWHVYGTHLLSVEYKKLISDTDIVPPTAAVAKAAGVPGDEAPTSGTPAALVALLLIPLMAFSGCAAQTTTVNGTTTTISGWQVFLNDVAKAAKTGLSDLQTAANTLYTVTQKLTPAQLNAYLVAGGVSQAEANVISAAYAQGASLLSLAATIDGATVAAAK